MLLLLVGAGCAYLAVRDNVFRTALTLAAGAVFLGPCAAFYLGYNGLPPFQMSDASGRQYALHRSVPGEVRYTDGSTVTVAAPTFETAAATAGQRIWIIPVRFANEIERDEGHVGRCSLYVDGRYRDPHRERDPVRALGDVDRRGVTSFEAGAAYDGRIAFEVPNGASQVVMECFRAYTVPAYFDLRPYTTAP
ncbi:MAG: hypothetical protein ACRDG6_03920 [Candidatus Limnocylindria bacterium]